MGRNLKKATKKGCEYMSDFLNQISTIMSFLLQQLSVVTSSLTSNPVFLLMVGVSMFTLVVVIICSFINIKINRSKLND